MNVVRLKLYKCNECIHYSDQDEDIDVGHGCAYTYIAPRCNKKNRNLDIKKPLIPDWCPLLNHYRKNIKK
jgi:hypothetical protein